MDIPLHGTDQEFSRIRPIGPGKDRLQELKRPGDRIPGHNELGKEELTALKPVADNGRSYAIGSFTDWSRTSSQYSDFIITSILVNADDATLDAIDSLTAGSFSGGEVELGLKDKGVGLASIFVRPPNISADVASWVDDLKIEVKDLEAGIAAGEIDISG